jgi:hypothetical protein
MAGQYLKCVDAIHITSILLKTCFKLLFVQSDFLFPCFKGRATDLGLGGLGGPRVTGMQNTVKL